MSNDNKSYNGWSNYETWNCALWLNNDGSMEYLIERATELRDADPDSATYNLAQEIESMIDENNPIGDQSSMFSDMLSAALREVDYDEIAEHIISDLDLPEEEEEEEEEED